MTVDPHFGPAVTESPVDESQTTPPPDLGTLKKDELIERAKAAGVPEEDLGDTKAELAEQIAAKENGQYYSGDWKPGHPIYQCPHCAFNTLAPNAVEGDALIEEHISGFHQAYFGLAGGPVNG